MNAQYRAITIGAQQLHLVDRLVDVDGDGRSAVDRHRRTTPWSDRHHPHIGCQAKGRYRDRIEKRKSKQTHAPLLARPSLKSRMTSNVAAAVRPWQTILRGHALASAATRTAAN